MSLWRIRWRVVLSAAWQRALVALALCLPIGLSCASRSLSGEETVKPPLRQPDGDDEPTSATDISEEVDSDFEVITPASFKQPQPVPAPPLDVVPVPRVSMSGVARATPSLLNSRELNDELLKSRRGRARTNRPATNVVSGREAAVRSTTDAGNLLGKSAASAGLGVQRRTPIVNDPRIRSSRVGSQNASGSYWFPARIDLDTQLSKLDARIVDNIVVVKGPYSALYGPDLRFFDVELLGSPRFDDGFESHGSSSVEYRTNGEQWYGRQSLWGGDEDWGYRIGYGHRTGNDYQSGDGTDIPSSYKSRDFDATIGFDLDPDNHIEFTYLRLDQTDVEFPGQAFDMNFLVTDGFEGRWRSEGLSLGDRLEADVWFNQTRFAGDTSRPGKARQFPIFAPGGLSANTDVASSSAGYRVLWGGDIDENADWTLGTDLRYLRQDLNERISGDFLGNMLANRNSPIPGSHWANPGLLMEAHGKLDDRWELRGGARLDYVSANIDESLAALGPLGGAEIPVELSDILGTSNFQQERVLASAFFSGQYALDSDWNITFGAGHAERAPNLTELYAAESFMFLLQNGLNTVTGDPLLKKEQLWQIDLGLSGETEHWRGSANVFHAWIHDAITFENMETQTLGPGQDQSRLKYVNTDLVTMFGFDLATELDFNHWLTGFGTMSYVQADDQTRNGNFRTEPFSASLGGGISSSRRLPGLSRSCPGMIGPSQESLAGIVPLETRLGIRLHGSNRETLGAELSARIVDNQSRVASCLLETPTPGFTTWDLRTFWRPAPAWLLIAGVENFTNKNYFEHLDYRSTTSNTAVFQPGANFYVSTEVTY